VKEASSGGTAASMPIWAAEARSRMAKAEK
jgi:hypothetical protein